MNNENERRTDNQTTCDLMLLVNRQLILNKSFTSSIAVFNVNAGLMKGNGVI